MNKNLIGLLILLAVVAVFCALLSSSSQAPNAHAAPPTINEVPREPNPAPPDPLVVPAPPALRVREQIAGKPMRVHWKIKLPDDRLHMKNGDYAIRDNKAFAEFLGPRADHYIRWNKVDFAKQMVIAHVFQYPEGNWIDSMVRTQKEIVVQIGVWHPTSPMPAIVKTEVVAVAVNRCDLPVRFAYFDDKTEEHPAATPLRAIADGR